MGSEEKISKKKSKKITPKTQLEGLLQSLEQKVEQGQALKYNPQKHKDETRSAIALIFTRGFFGLMIGVLAGVPIYNLLAHFAGSELLPIKDVLLAVSSTVNGALGFVIGHYFKSDND